MGGLPISAPALLEAPRPVPDLCALVERLRAARNPILVCLTAAGLRALFAQAAGQGCGAALDAAVARAVTVCRGPKPAGVLAARGLPVSLKAAAPFTTAQVIDALEGIDLRGMCAAVVHHGERNDALASWLVERGAELHELLPYEWRLPADTGPVRQLAAGIIAGDVDAVAFTTQVQVKHLFEIAGPSQAVPLAFALNERTVTGAIGPTCAAALETAGVRPAVVADPPKLGPLLAGLARILQERTIA